MIFQSMDQSRDSLKRFPPLPMQKTSWTSPSETLPPLPSWETLLNHLSARVTVCEDAVPVRVGNVYHPLGNRHPPKFAIIEQFSHALDPLDQAWISYFKRDKLGATERNWCYHHFPIFDSFLVFLRQWILKNKSQVDSSLKDTWIEPG